MCQRKFTDCNAGACVEANGTWELSALVNLKLLQKSKIYYNIKLLKIYLQYDPTITFLGIYPREIKTYVRNTHIHTKATMTLAIHLS